MFDVNKLIGFDIEISKEIPPDTDDITPYRPLGISCASAVAQDFSTLWYGRNEAGEVQPSMSRAEVLDMLFWLAKNVTDGYHIVTWNGLQFDFDILAEESGDKLLCQKLALGHFDVMFQFVCMYGFPVGLNTIAKGMGLAGKTEGVHGDLVPWMWNDQNDKLKEAGREDLANMLLKDKRNLCLKYVEQDSRTTLEVIQRISETKEVKWTARSGRFNRKWIGNLMTVKECLELPFPDTSWMTNPTPREEYLAWFDK